MAQPVLFLVYKRLDLVKQVFASIKEYQPERLYVAADGAKSDADFDVCRQVREYILESIDWECEVTTLFRDQNLGSSLAVSSAITWFFEHEEEGIILEDDCLPTPSFFIFCEKMLEKYRKDDEVMHIAGCNSYGEIPIKEDYFFSKYSLSWGWATWSRAWKKFDYHLSFLAEQNCKEFFWSHASKDYNQYIYWLRIYNDILNKKYDCWDYQWLFSIWFNKGKSIISRYNFISNIGFSIDALHTKNIESPMSHLRTFNILKSNFNNTKLPINKKNDCLLFYFVFMENYDTTLRNCKRKEKRIKTKIVEKILSKKYSIRDKIYMIKNILIYRRV